MLVCNPSFCASISCVILPMVGRGTPTWSLLLLPWVSEVDLESMPGQAGLLPSFPQVGSFSLTASWDSTQEDLYAPLCKIPQVVLKACLFSLRATLNPRRPGSRLPSCSLFFPTESHADTVFGNILPKGKDKCHVWDTTTPMSPPAGGQSSHSAERAEVASTRLTTNHHHVREFMEQVILLHFSEIQADGSGVNMLAGSSHMLQA